MCSLPEPPPKTEAVKPDQAAVGADPPKVEPCTLIVNSIRAEANEQSLRLLFESAGKVVGCKLVKDAESGGHKGFGFVMMGSRSEAETAVEKFNKLQVRSSILAITTSAKIDLLQLPFGTSVHTKGPQIWTLAR